MGSPRAVGRGQQVPEPVHGYLSLAEKLWTAGAPYCEAWNFGPEDHDARTVSWMAERLTGMWGDGASWAPSSAEQPHEAYYLKLDISKARTVLGWRPRWRLEEALRRTVGWHRAYLAREDMRAVTLGQIQDFMASGHQ